MLAPPWSKRLRESILQLSDFALMCNVYFANIKYKHNVLIKLSCQLETTILRHEKALADLYLDNMVKI